MMAINQTQCKRYILFALIVLGSIFSGNSVNARETAIEPVAREIMPSIVRVTGYMRIAGTEDQYRKYAESSGFFVGKEGFLLTVYSAYVNSETRILCEKFEIELFDGRVIRARMLAVDPPLGLAILKTVEEGEYRALDISSSPGSVTAEEVWAIAAKNSGNEVPVFPGRVKAKNKSSMYEEGCSDLLIDIYMELPAYAHGGPLVNNEGEVLGFNIPFSHRDASGEEITDEEHAVPISDITTIYQVLLANPTFEQKWLGFDVRPINRQERALVMQILQQRGGVVVDFVWEEGPAAKTGIRSGDILVGMNGSPVLTANHLKGTLFETGNNTPAELRIIRDGVLVSEPGRVEKRPLWAAP